MPKKLLGEQKGYRGKFSVNINTKMYGEGIIVVYVVVYEDS